MNDKATPYAFYKIGLIVFIFGLLLIPSSVCLAQQDVEDLPDFYPESFTGDGCIDRITKMKIVIQDRSFRLSPHITFHTPSSQYASRSRFKKGMRIGYIKNSQNEIESIWYIQSCR